MITYLIQPVFRSDFYLTEIQARIESVYRLVSSYCCIQPRKKIRSESDPNIIGCVASLDFEIIEFKHQFCGNTHTHTQTHKQTTIPSAYAGEGNNCSMTLNDCLHWSWPDHRYYT